MDGGRRQMVDSLRGEGSWEGFAEGRRDDDEIKRRGEREMRGRTRETCSNRLVNRRMDG